MYCLLNKNIENFKAIIFKFNSNEIENFKIVIFKFNSINSNEIKEGY